QLRLHWDFDRLCNRQMLSFGWKTELSSLLQFFNYRLTYYLLAYFISRGSVGIFSIGVTVAEAIWVVSRSVSMVQFSNVLKQGNTMQSRKETMSLALVSLGISAACILVILLLPASLFVFVFGPEFGEVKRVVLLLAPGILAIAFSNVLGNYFSAIRKLNILIIKSLIGLIFTLVLALWLIPRWQIDGACIVNAASYLISSVVLFLYYLSKKSVVDIHE
ncbi:MAG: polysaccharide biosynthesis C-terminal domain-containing protein, partial [Bacteroidales bacterium]|nr:polysaccharide biosynthesis C-terminal domain-containing protein [Bacteroidales bacterium]